MNEFPPQVGDIWQYGDLLHRFEVLSQEKVGTRFRYKVCRLKNGEICKMWMGDRPWRLIMRPGTEDTFPPQIGDVWEIGNYTHNQYEVVQINTTNSQPYLLRSLDQGKLVSMRMHADKDTWYLIDRKEI